MMMTTMIKSFSSSSVTYRPGLETEGKGGGGGGGAGKKRKARIERSVNG